MRWHVLTVLAMIALSLPAPALAQSRAVPVTPDGHGTVKDILTPLAGDGTTLVYSRQERLARDENYAASTYPGEASGPSSLYARSSAGKVSYIGKEPTGDFAADERWSLFGNVLAAGAQQGDDPVPLNPAVAWSLKTGVRHVISGKGNFLSAAPGGVALAGQHGTVIVRSLSGHTARLGQPFGADAFIDYGAAGPTGIVVGTDGRLAFIPWASPSTPVQLADPDNANRAIACSGVGARYAVCDEAPIYDEDDDFDSHSAFLVPLDGGPATKVDASICAYPAASLDGDSMLLACESSPPGQPYDRRAAAQLYEQSAGSSAAVPVTSSTSATLVAAYGEAVAQGVDGIRLVTVSEAGELRPVVGRKPSPVTVDSFSLSSRRVVYSDDERVASRDGQVESVFTRRLSVHGSKPHLSGPHLLSAGSSRVSGNLVGASSELAVYGTVDVSHVGAPGAALHVVSSRGAHNIQLGSWGAQGWVEVSGSRVLYRVKDSFYVWDDATRTSTRIVVGHSTRPALSGHYVAYAGSRGAIHRLNLVTGKKVRIAPNLVGDAVADEVTVYESGRWVGWNVQDCCSGKRPVTRIRNVETMAKPITLHHTLYSLSSAGALEASSNVTFYELGAQDGGVDAATTFWLRSYSGRHHTLLSKRRFVAGPQIAGHWLAWAGSDGRLHIKQVAAPY